MKVVVRVMFVAMWALLSVAFLLAPTARAQQTDPTAMIVGFLLPTASEEDDLRETVVQHFRQGLRMGVDEFVFNASILGVELEFIDLQVGTPQEAISGYETLVEEHDVALVIGGLDTESSIVASAAAARTGVPFLNIASSSHALRNRLCNDVTFHVAPSAGMYLDALAGWYVRAGFRRWYFVVGADDESQSQLERARWSLRERHFGAREVGQVIADQDIETAVSEVARANPDLILLLLPTDRQLAFLRAMETQGFESEVTGFPYLDAQTRAFFAASAEAAPTLGTGRRASAWEPTLDAYGARELNARYQNRFGEPMETPAWAAFQAVKMVFEATALGGATEPDAIAAYFRSQNSVFDLWKGIGVTFRPWNQQLRQPLYLIKIVPDASTLRDGGLLVGELPAIYMPQTDPVERLDQLGDLANSTKCVF